MKKPYFVLIAMLTMLCAARTAYADIADPVGDAFEKLWPFILITIAVIIIAVIFEKTRKK